MKQKAGGHNPAIYNSNNQKMCESHSSRNNNAPNNHHFGSGVNEQQDGRAVLGGLPINNTQLQKSGELHTKVDRQNSFVLYGGGLNKSGQRSGTLHFGHKHQ